MTASLKISLISNSVLCLIIVTGQQLERVCQLDGGTIQDMPEQEPLEI